ncbi:MAG: bifunctional glutamate N-acetyltransferase/amino-acid acetyltransferase ArgJ [Dehalococcoidales bacterium]|nr:bifunctional glutamate N-acetyltransferase/amino-acid acetyltransferase ArgJ [Dehalococcoidales bacterium]
MSNKIDIVDKGSVTTPDGFQAGAVFAGINKKALAGLDMGVIFSTAPCNTAGVFTKNRIKAAPVIVSQERLKLGKAAAIVANSGCANACTGKQGISDAEEISRLVAENLGITATDVLVASTGVIGQPLPMDIIRASVPLIKVSRDGGHDFAKAIMTTDKVEKEIAVRVKYGKNTFHIGGAAKGAGMIHPDMATMLGFLTTDAEVDLEFLREALRKAADISFNMISVDGDTSTNDTVFLMANGQSENDPITAEDIPYAEVFQEALNEVCIYLAKAIIRDGEGATKLIEATVSGALNEAEARKAARTIVSSPLVKTAVYGNDPNWGRIIAAVGRSGIAVDEHKVSIYIGNICVFKAGQPQSFNLEKAGAALQKTEVPIEVKLNMGDSTAIAWGSDLTEGYIRINAEYTT